MIAARLNRSVYDVRAALAADENVRSVYAARVGELVNAVRIYGPDLQGLAVYIGTDRATAEAWIRENPAARTIYESARAGMVDLAERNLMVSLAKGDRWATELVLLNTQEAARRGYGKQVNVSVEHEAASLGVDINRLLDVVSAQLVAGVIVDNRAIEVAA